MDIEQVKLSLRQLLPPGKAWDWIEGGVGDSVLKALADELVRLGGDAEALAAQSVELHTPPTRDWSTAGWQRYLAANGISATAVDGQHPIFECGASQCGDALNQPPMNCVVTIKLISGDSIIAQALADAYKQTHTQVEIVDA